jgi:glycosyltransferase involved in cell wall biosynthesis
MHILVMTRIVLGHSLGGMQKQTMDLCQGFAKAGHRVTVITTGRKDGVRHEDNDGIETHYLEGTKPGYYSRKWNSAARKKISEIHQSTPIDVIHSQSMGANGVLKWARRNAVPVVSTWHGTSLTEFTSFFGSASYHPRYWHWLFITPATFLKNYAMKEIPVRKASKAITLVSPTLEPHMKLFAKGKVKVIPNGVFVPKEYLTKSEDDIIQIISIGRVVRQKGIQHAINAIANLPPEIQNKVHLNIVGEGDYHATLEKLTIQNNLQKMVTFHGKVIGKPLQDIYQQCQIHLMPTTSHEGLPLTILEGMAFGLTTIASKIGGIPSAITDGVNGFLIKPGNVQELTQKLKSLIEKPQKISAIGDAARTSVVNHYSEEIMIERTLTVLNSVV